MEMDRRIYDYKYTQLSGRLGGLEEIRIIALEPAPSAISPLRCQLQHVELESAKYNAMSYTWGLPVFDKELIVDGEQTIAITSNLDLAFRRMRRPESVVHVWADAVCINQRDFDEKDHQIRLMGQIYTRASRVFAWTGPDNRARDGAGCLRRLWEIARRETEVKESIAPHYIVLRSFHEYMYGSNPMEEKEQRNTSEMVSLPERQWSLTSMVTEADNEMVDDFLKKAYFTRRWIVQEMALTTPEKLIVFCGDTELNGLSFYYALRALRGLRVSTASANIALLKPLLRMVDDLAAVNKTTPVGWLRDFMDFKCADERDHVLSQLSIFEARGGPSTKKRFGDVSYATRVSKVYTRLAEYQLDCQGDHRLCVPELLVVSSSLRRQTGPGELPSWVPDWRQTPKYQVPAMSDLEHLPTVMMPSAFCRRAPEMLKPGRLQLGGVDIYVKNGDDGAYVEERDIHNLGWTPALENAMGPLHLEPRRPHSRFLAAAHPVSSSLRVSGLPFDTVHDVVDADLSTPDGRMKLWERAASWPSIDYYRSVCGSTRRALSETVSAHAYLLNLSNPNFSAWLRWQQSILLDLLDVTRGLFDIWELGQFERQYLPEVMSGRSVFCTKLGYFGVCSDDVRPGDTVAVILESPMAFILRNAPAATSFSNLPGLMGDGYELISDTYIHGLDIVAFGRHSPRFLHII